MRNLKVVEDNVDMKAKIEKVLNDTENYENRAAKMDIDDLLKSVFRAPLSGWPSLTQPA